MSCDVAMPMGRSPSSCSAAGPLVGHVGVALDGDALLAHVAADGLFLRHGLLGQSHPSFGTVSVDTTGRSWWVTTSCSPSEIAGPDMASPTLSSVIGSRSTRTSS